MNTTERETRTFTTPGGHAVVLNAYLTGREANAIKEAMFGAMKLNVEDVREGKVNVSDVPGTFLAEQERRTLGYLVVSVDGDASSPLERLLDLPSSEYDAVKAEVDKIANPTTPEKSAQLGAGTSRAAQ